MYPFNEFDVLSFKIIVIAGTFSEIKKHCMGVLISAKNKYKIMEKLLIFILKQFSIAKEQCF